MNLAAALIVAAAVVVAGLRIAAAIQASRADAIAGRALELMALFAPAVGTGASDPRAMLAWQPLARTARQLFPEAFARIDAAAGGAFPFSKERLEAAHAQWTSDWLAWEQTHDAEYKLKAAIVEEQIAVAGVTPVLRARLDAVEREKLGLYQRRYEEYVRVSKSLKALVT